MIYRGTTKTAFWLWIVATLFFGAFGFFLSYFFPFLNEIISAIFLILTAISGIYLPLLVKKTYCKIDGDKIYSQTGVIFTRSTTINLNDVLYSSVCKTPLSSFTGLNFIILNTFGGKTMLLFLSKDDCKEIRELIS